MKVIIIYPCFLGLRREAKEIYGEYITEFPMQGSGE